MFCMDHLHISLCAFLLLAGVSTSNGAQVPFATNFDSSWGHVTVLDQGTQAQLMIDQHSGGGFTSKLTYASGRIGMTMKIPKNSKGIIATFYLTSESFGKRDGRHDELDFEFIGTDNPPYTLSTNVFAQDFGSREQQFNLWFDPTSEFHEYEFLWNYKQIVFFVDGVPIRVFKNNKQIGVNYPVLPMYVAASLWNMTQWVGPVDWSKGPFVASYHGFDINGCLFSKSNLANCYSQTYEWNRQGNWQLNAEQLKAYKDIRKRYMTYDYCQSKTGTKFVECGANS